MVNPITPAVGAVTSIFGPVAPSSGEAASGLGSGFTGVLKQAINQVSGLQSDAAAQVGNVLAGGSADLGQTTVAVEKADVAFQLLLQVRNKVVAAYQDLEKAQF